MSKFFEGTAYDKDGEAIHAGVWTETPDVVTIETVLVSGGSKVPIVGRLDPAEALCLGLALIHAGHVAHYNTDDVIDGEIVNDEDAA